MSERHVPTPSTEVSPNKAQNNLTPNRPPIESFQNRSSQLHEPVGTDAFARAHRHGVYHHYGPDGK